VARDLFGQALQLRQASRNSSALEAESQTDLALVLADDDQLPAAARAMRDALDHLRAAGGERNALGVDIWLNLGDIYARQHNLVEAEAGYRQALDIALSRFGGGHPRTAQAQYQLAKLLTQRGKLDEAGQLLSLAQDTLAARWGRNGLELAEPWRLRGHIELERDHPTDAEAALAEATRLWRSHAVLAAHAPDLCTLSQLQRRNQQLARSDSSADECLDLLRQRTIDPTPALSELVGGALDLGDVTAAAKWFKQIPRPLVNSLADAMPMLVRARYAMHSGRDDEAITTILAVQARLAEKDPGNRELRWQSQALQADLACRNQQVDAGMVLRAQVLHEAATAAPERIYFQKRLARLSAACPALP
jgi:tetratricopeptide (TPR) repeat protein